MVRVEVAKKKNCYSAELGYWRKTNTRTKTLRDAAYDEAPVS
jgi:hypothetical protein